MKHSIKIFSTLLLIIFININAQAQLGVTVAPVTPAAAPVTNGQAFFPVMVTSNNAICPPHIPGSAGTNPYEMVWLEYGDGRFTTDSFSRHQFINATTVNMLTKGTPIYGGGGHPPLAIINKTMSTSIALQDKDNAIDPDLVTAGNILITPNVRDIVPGDTMMFAISYKLADQQTKNCTKAYYISFNYNMNGSMFQVVNPSDQVGFQPDGGTSLSYNVNQIRVHNGEAIGTYSIAPATSTAGNGLIWKITTVDTKEHNIFLTLKVVSPVGSNISGQLNAKIIEVTTCGKSGSTTAITGSNDLDIPLSYNLLSHDPNFETVQPNCVLFAEKPNTTFKYHIHFQNTGRGAATHIIARTALPGSLRLSDIVIDSAKIGANKLDIFDNSNNPYYTFNTSSERRSDSVNFEFTNRGTNIVLAGTDGTSNASVNIKTMGDVYFHFVSNNSMPNLLLSQTSIYFDSNEAVKTGECRAEFKEFCSCNCKSSKCDDKKRSKFWRWLFCKKC